MREQSFDEQMLVSITLTRHGLVLSRTQAEVAMKYSGWRVHRAYHRWYPQSAPDRLRAEGNTRSNPMKLALTLNSTRPHERRGSVKDNSSTHSSG